MKSLKCVWMPSFAWDLLIQSNQDRERLRERANSFCSRRWILIGQLDIVFTYPAFLLVSEYVFLILIDSFKECELGIAFARKSPRLTGNDGKISNNPLRTWKTSIQTLLLLLVLNLRVFQYFNWEKRSPQKTIFHSGITNEWILSSIT